MEGGPGSGWLNRCQVKHWYCRVTFWVEGKSLFLLLQTTQTANLEWERESNRNTKNEGRSRPHLGPCTWPPKSYQKKGESPKAFSLLIFPEKLKGPPLLGYRHHPRVCWLSWCARRNARLWVWPQTHSSRGFLLCHLPAVWLWEST